MSDGHPLFDPAVPAGRLMARLDWGATPIGPPETWPESLRGAVRTVLSSRYPMLLLWGEQFTQIYNDAYSALIGDRHPAAMGEDVRVTLAEGWPVLGPIVDEAVATGVASWVPALQLLLDRAGYREEAYFSVSHAPARDDEGVTRGVLTVCSEVTEQVVGERRLRLLRDLSLREDHTRSPEQVCAQLVAALAEHPLDVPFAGLYLHEGPVLRRAASSGAHLPDHVAVDDPGPLGLAGAAGGLVTNAPVPLHPPVPGGPWGDPVTEAVALPLPSAERSHPLGVLLVGVNPNRALDEGYRSFLVLLAQQAAVALRNARAYEEERARAEALAEMDRVKTSFFTGVSHEFRTPLTLLLGPLQDALEDPAVPLPAVHRDRVQTAVRASTRLRKLVDDLLTFSSLEAGRAVADRRVVDLAALTRDAASSFRAAVERAGLRLEVHCPPLVRPVAVDPTHWETVVTNLVSNALKFTFVGGVTVALDGDDDGVRLVVADTGVGIPAGDLPHLFERFRRVTGTRARSHEGSGIGLALVSELTALHGGTVEVGSEVGVGTRFAVRLPWSAVAPDPGVGSGDGAAASGAVAAAVQQVQSWDAAGDAPGEAADGADDGADEGAGRRASEGRVLVADDNADVREYLVRLLREDGWSVHAVSDGRTALHEALRRPPDLLLTDVMMPGLDGFGLVRALRADERTATLPIVVLSARAGREASAEGLETGADDYVVKPFTSRDLLARVRAAVRLARQRTAHVRHLAGLADAAAVITSGQDLGAALDAVVGQVRALLAARRATLTLVGGGQGRSLEFTSGTAADPTAAGEVLERVVTGRDERPLGVLRVEWSAADGPQPEAPALLRPLAGVLAAVVEGGWRVAPDSSVVAALQEFLLPAGLPEVPGLALAAAYRPAEQHVQVGGDWYDVLPLPDGRVAISVGDVAGHGLTAALAMGQLRAAVRACAVDGLSPAAAVAALDELVSRLPGTSFATAFLGYLDLTSGDLDWCSAGQPPPVLVPPSGPPGWLVGEVGAALGAGAAAPPPRNTTRLQDGARLVLYTDGLVEDRRSQLDAGMPALLDRLGAATADDVDGLLAAALDGTQAGRADDVAVLVVRRAATAAARVAAAVRDVDLELAVPATPKAAGVVRRSVRPALQGAGLDDDVVFDVLVALSEAVNNAVEHAVDPTRPEVCVRVRVRAAEQSLEFVVRDHGQWRERRSSMDRGHGSVLMGAGGRVSVVPSAEGTTVTVTRSLGAPPRGADRPGEGAGSR